ncbi:MAG: TonB-dependent receptor [Nitrosomonas sp.]|nr:TonB-dependent receptor [Nitrosomonas sp.]
MLTRSLAAANSTDAHVTKDQDIFAMSLEELMNVEVVSVSKRSQRLSEVPSAVFVISGEDIRRSGATSIPEALRMAPGVQVARIGTDKWSISIRGFNGRFSNKLLVLMDGRSVYTPLSSGVIWSQQDTFIEDIDRIEVVRGPAATLWGVNAVNGVINIITKKAEQTQGALFTAGGGSFEQGFVGARYGGKINEDTPFRVYAKGFIRDHTTTLSGASANDNWHSARAGFRVDHVRGNDDFTLQGDMFVNGITDTVIPPVLLQSNSNPHIINRNETGGNIRLRWDRSISERSSMMLQTYYDRVSNQLAPQAKYVESFDTEFQHRFPLFDRHDLTWGVNYRLFSTNARDTLFTTFVPRQASNYFVSGFIRDEISVLPDKLKFSLGVRLGYNNFSGVEVQPNARIMWTPDTRNSVWASISRAVRTPSRGEHDVIINNGVIPPQPDLTGSSLPIMQAILGSNRFGSEKLIAYELGYRHQFNTHASIDIAGFYNDYSDLRDFEVGMIRTVAGAHRDLILTLLQQEHLMLPVFFNNQGSAQSYGAEVSIDWRPHERWRLQGNYSYLEIDTKSNPAFVEIDASTGGAGKANPRHQMSLRSNFDLSERLQFNLWLRYVDDLPFYNISNYITMDAKMSWKPVKNVEFFLVGQNLFSENHRESQSDFINTVASRIPRGIYTGVRWDF